MMLDLHCMMLDHHWFLLGVQARPLMILLRGPHIQYQHHWREARHTLQLLLLLGEHHMMVEHLLQLEHRIQCLH